MLLVVADTSPLRYLVEIDQIGLLPLLFENIFIPSPVYGELLHEAAPASVRTWASSPPDWLKVLADPLSQDPGLAEFRRRRTVGAGAGEALGADLILIDDRKRGCGPRYGKDLRSRERWAC